MLDTLSRRKFLHTSAVAAGGLLSRGAKAIMLEPQAQIANQPVGASDQIRFGIIGVGMEGSGVLSSAISLPGAKCVAAADLYDGRHTLAKEITGDPDLYTTRHYQELLERKDIDCILAAVPDFWHKQVVVDSVRAGKPIYCEKPMSHTAADGVAMVAAAKETGKIDQLLFTFVRFLLRNQKCPLILVFDRRLRRKTSEAQLHDGLSAARGIDMSPC